MKWLRYTSILFYLFISSCKPIKVTQTDAQPIVVSSQSGIDSSLYYMLKDYKVVLDEKMNQIISYTGEDLIRAQPSSNLGNMMADVIYNFYLGKNDTVDMAIMNQGGIRVPVIYKGNLTMRDAYQLMPFDNEIVQIEISGSVLMTFLKHACKMGGWPVSHTEIVMNASQEIVSARINGEEIDPEKIYRVATNDYIANGGDQCHFLIGLPQKKSGMLLRDVIINFWNSQPDGIQTDNSKRIRYE